MAQINTRTGNINTRSAKYNRDRAYDYDNLSFSAVAEAAAEYVGERILEGKRERARERANAPIIIRNKGKKKPFPVSFVFYAAVLSLVFVFLVYNYSLINSMSYENERIEAEISALEDENAMLSLELDKRNDLAYIEDYAINELGMVKSTDVVKQYVSLSSGDNIVVTEENVESTYLGTTLNSLKSSVCKIFE